MPLYEYRCEQGHTFELVQRMSEDSLDSCEVCGAPAQRVMHAPAVHFKGKGFYNTDYGTKNRQRETEANKSSESKSSSETKSSEPKGSDGKGSDSGSSDSGGSAAKPEKKPDKKETAAASGS